MKKRHWLSFGLALIAAFALAAALPLSASAQQNNTRAYAAPQGQDYGSYYGYNGSNYMGTYCPMGPDYGYSASANRAYRNPGTQSWGRGHRGSWGQRTSGYARGYRSGWGYCW